MDDQQSLTIQVGRCQVTGSPSTGHMMIPSHQNGFAAAVQQPPQLWPYTPAYHITTAKQI